MKVLHVIDSLNIGGSESLVATLVAAFQERGVENVVCGLGADGPLPARLALSDCKSFYLDKAMGIRPSVMIRIGRIAVAERCDVIMTHHFRQLFHSLPAAFLLRKKLVHVEHDSHSYTAQPGLVGRLSKLAPFVHRFCFVSEEILQWFTANMPTAANKFVKIENGVNTHRFTPSGARRKDTRQRLGISEDAVVFGTCARLEPVKDLHLLLRAFALLADNPKFRLVIAGDGSLRNELESLARDLDIADNCHFLGMVDDIPGALCAMDVYTITSANEGLPLSVLEAMSTGLPVVSVNVGALDTVIDEQVGVLLDGRAPEECSKALAQLGTEPTLRNSLGNAARQRILTNYSLEAMVDAYLKTLQVD